MVPLARMGLHAEKGHHDDSAEALRQGADDAELVVSRVSELTSAPSVAAAAHSTRPTHE